MANDGVFEEYYAPHLYRGANRFRNSTQRQRLALIERMYQRVLLELAMNRFKWEGLPPEVDIRWMEMQLALRALSVFFYSDDYKRYFAMQGTASGQQNMIGNPTEFTVTGNLMFSKRLDANDCVPIWANYMRVPDMDIIMIFANRLAQLDRTVEINAMGARRGKVLVASENAKLSVQNINRQMEEGVAAITVNQDISGMVQNFDLGIDPLAVLNMDMVQSRVWNKAMGLLGINNSNQDKKERLVADEVQGNNDQVASVRSINLNAREQAVERINAKYKLNVTVSYNTDIDIPTVADEGATDA